VAPGHSRGEKNVGIKPSGDSGGDGGRSPAASLAPKRLPRIVPTPPSSARQPASKLSVERLLERKRRMERHFEELRAERKAARLGGAAEKGHSVGRSAGAPHGEAKAAEKEAEAEAAGEEEKVRACQRNEPMRVSDALMRYDAWRNESSRGLVRRATRREANGPTSHLTVALTLAQEEEEGFEKVAKVVVFVEPETDPKHKGPAIAEPSEVEVSFLPYSIQPTPSCLVSTCRRFSGCAEHQAAHPKLPTRRSLCAVRQQGGGAHAERL
jgi:hypothetical protein